MMAFRGAGRSIDTATEVETLFRSEYRRLVSSLTLLAGDEERAADAVQEAFVQALRRWRKIRGYEQPEAWVRRVAVNRLLNERRNTSRRSELVAKLAQVSAPVAIDSWIETEEMLASLPLRQRVVLTLHYVGGYSVAEIADVLEISPGTVKSQLHDGRKNLRARDDHGT